MSTAAESKGAFGSTPENSQITAPAPVTAALVVIVRVVAPAVEFLAYQMSFSVPMFVSIDRAAPASAYTFPALSVMVVMVVEVLTFAPICHPTTNRFPLPVAGIVQVVPGRFPGPQDVACTIVI